LKRIVPTSIITVVGLFALIPTAAPQPQPTPQSSPASAAAISFKETTFHVGEIWEGDKASHTFSFTNTGNAVLHIKKVKTSCGCTAAVLSSKEIEPGQTGEIKATFNTRRYLGKQSKTIYVSSNDPRHSTVQLKLQATVKSAAHFSPRNLQFGEITRGEKASRVIKLVPDSEAIRITELSVHPDLFQARVKEDEEPGLNQAGEKAAKDPSRPVSIEVSIAPEAPIGRHNGTLTVRIDHPRVPSLAARIFARVEGQVRFSPRMLLFNEDARKQQIVKKIGVEKQDGEELKILSVESSTPWCKVELITTDPGRKFDIMVSRKPDLKLGRHQGEIIIRTDSPGQEEIKIPVRAHVKK